MQPFRKLQRLFKGIITIGLGLLNLTGILYITQLAQNAVFCSGLMEMLASLTTPFQILPWVRVAPIRLIPLLSNPNQVLALCSYTNVGTAIFLSALVTTLCVGLTTWLVATDIPHYCSQLVMRRRAKRARRKIQVLRTYLSRIDLNELSTEDLAILEPIVKALKVESSRPKV
ncbi:MULTISPECIES: hypothetical protein [Trichocoleus]|uniref:Uncharacterized protein n=1 Tax=Trichocoleus desertorum GB2-A4 TaxID=2933944 RepID=A0ABV0JHI5_9CYAN|nr:hypothetical protein [Trichocoleus sp. FACHB-46]MBD1862374.1 hypothetical protein [Trichocoleus sp. FACHB-46]